MPVEAWATLSAISLVAADCSSTAVAMVATTSLTSVITWVISADLAHGGGWWSLDALDFLLDVLGGLGGLLGQFLDLVGHHGKALAGLAGPGRLDGGVEGQQVDLFADVGDGFDHLADGVGRLPSWSMLVEALEALCRLVGNARAFSAFWAISPMVEDISSAAVATMLVLVADCSMAAATLFMLALISSVAAETVVDFSETFWMPWVICSEMADSSVEEEERVSTPPERYL
jgi:hypothetical protein